MVLTKYPLVTDRRQRTWSCHILLAKYRLVTDSGHGHMALTECRLVTDRQTSADMVKSF